MKEPNYNNNPDYNNNRKNWKCYSAVQYSEAKIITLEKQ